MFQGPSKTTLGGLVAPWMTRILKSGSGSLGLHMATNAEYTEYCRCLVSSGWLFIIIDKSKMSLIWFGECENLIFEIVPTSMICGIISWISMKSHRFASLPPATCEPGHHFIKQTGRPQIPFWGMRKNPILVAPGRATLRDFLIFLTNSTKFYLASWIKGAKYSPQAPYIH